MVIGSNKDMVPNIKTKLLELKDKHPSVNFLDPNSAFLRKTAARNMSAKKSVSI